MAEAEERGLPLRNRARKLGFALLDLDEADLTRALARRKGAEDGPRAIRQRNPDAAVVHEVNADVEFGAFSYDLLNAACHYASLPSRRSYSSRMSLKVVRQLAQSFAPRVSTPHVL
jgi:arginase family enzyme